MARTHIQPREPTFIAAIGVPGAGKTWENIQQIKRSLAGNPDKGVKGEKVLIFDSNREYNNRNIDVRKAGVYIKPIHISQVARFSTSNFVEACSIQPINDQAQPMSLTELSDGLTKVMGTFKVGLLIAEDFKSFSSDSIKADLVSKLCTRRHSGSDTLVSLQDIALVAPRVWPNLKWLRMHKLGDSVLLYKDRYPGKLKFLCIAENIVNKRYYEGDERFFVMIDLMKGFIYGKYSPAEFETAARQFIAENWQQTVGRELNMRDPQWNKINKDEKIAAGTVLSRLVQDFSQYSPRLKKP